MIPAYVSNQVKYLRAVKNLGAGATPEAIKAEYIKYGGLVIGEPDTQQGVEEGAIMFPVMTEEEKVVEIAKVEEKAKKRGRVR